MIVITVARKPLDVNVASTSIKWGTGGINIDASRIAFEDGVDMGAMQCQHDGTDRGFRFAKSRLGKETSMYKPGGRWPANMVMGYCLADQLVYSHYFKRVG